MQINTKLQSMAIDWVKVVLMQFFVSNKYKSAVGMLNLKLLIPF